MNRDEKDTHVRYMLIHIHTYIKCVYFKRLGISAAFNERIAPQQTNNAKENPLKHTNLI